MSIQAAPDERVDCRVCPRVTACGGGGDDTSGDVTLRSAGRSPSTLTTSPRPPPPKRSPLPVVRVGRRRRCSKQRRDGRHHDNPSAGRTRSGEALFEAVGVFQSCLDAEGYEFIGIPFQEETDPEAPVNQQPYIDALVACAARSQIQERLAEADAAQADLTAEEVENQNRQFIAFRDCMVGRGWGIPEPVPNEQGLLFGGFASTTSWVAPGESLTTSDDLGECQSEAGASAGATDVSQPDHGAFIALALVAGLVIVWQVTGEEESGDSPIEILTDSVGRQTLRDELTLNGELRRDELDNQLALRRASQPGRHRRRRRNRRRRCDSVPRRPAGGRRQRRFQFLPGPRRRF